MFFPVRYATISLSMGGIMLPEEGQSPLSEFLRHGAAGASGTVVEPLTLLQAKFPLASMHLHYSPRLLSWPNRFINR